MDTRTFAVGDLVVVSDMYARPEDRGCVYRVTKVLKVNLVVEPVNGGRAMRGNPYLFEPAPTGAAATVETVPYLAPLHAGQVVKVAGPGWKQTAENLYVVLGEKADQKVKIARLGGEGGRYWPSIPRAMLTVAEVPTSAIVHETV